MESGEGKAEQRQQAPVTPKKRRRPKLKSAQANGGSSSSAAESSPPLSRTSSSSPPSDDADGKGEQQHEQGGGGKRPRLVWTTELHNLFVKAYESLGKGMPIFKSIIDEAYIFEPQEAVPRRILEKMNETMHLPEVNRENIASHLQKHKINLRSKGALGAEASTHSHSLSPTEELPASHTLRSLPSNKPTPLAEVTPPDCLSSSSSSSIATNLHILQSIQQQLCGPPTPIKGSEQAQPAQTMQPAPADLAGCSPIKEGHGWSLEQKSHCTEQQRMETLTTAILVPEASTEAVIRMVQAGKSENAAAEPEAAAPAAGILAQFWASPDNESCTSSWDIFGLPRGT